MSSERLQGYANRIWRGEVNRLNNLLTYAIWNGECIKIGRTEGHPQVRVEQLKTGSSRPLTLLAYTSTISERAAHRLLSRYKVKGEWYLLSNSVLGLIRGWDWVNEPLYYSIQEMIQGVSDEEP